MTPSTGHTFGSLNYATMHKVLLIVIFILSVMSSNAQDTIPPQVPKSKKRKMPKKEMLLVNLNFDSWVGHPSYVSPQWGASRGVDVAILYDYVLGKSNFSLAGGLGFNSHNIHSEGFPVVYNTIDGDTYTKLDTSFFRGQDISVNKISTNFIDIPLEVRFRSKAHKNGKRIAAAIGFKLGFLVQSHTKTETETEYSINGVDIGTKFKTYDIENLTFFRYGLTARVGYANFYLNFFYSFTPLFEDGRGTEATPISIGIGVSPF